MISSNLLSFLTAIFVLSVSSAPEQPGLPPWLALPLFGLLLLVFHQLAGRQFRRVRHSAAYFAAEKKLTALAVLLFAAALFGLDLKHYLHPLSLDSRLPVLENAGGLVLFFLFLALMWRQAHPVYESLFGRSASPAAFAAANIRSSLPLVLPWLLLSLIFDLLNLLPVPGVQELLASAWGELILLPIFLLALALLFPPLIWRLWSCVPLEPGPLRSQIEAFCRSRNFSAEILSWPLLEGRALTAAVMGIAPRFRYLLLTPALLAALDRDELESVLAHEIGHVRRQHLLLYVLLLFGFSLLAGALSAPLLGLLFRSGWFWRLLIWSQAPLEKLLTGLAAAVLFVLMLLYFRFLFGYFVRNFERQADLHVFQAQGSSLPLIRSFEKIAALSGAVRDQKNWHHFGIGERIDFLLRCERDRKLVRRHDRKVCLSLAAYFLLIGLAVWPLRQVDADALSGAARVQYASALVEEKLRQEPAGGRWLQLRADLLLARGREKEALAAYEQALRAAPMQAETANNLAWLLLTAQDRSLRDPARALQLAEAAVSREAKGHRLDTLAVALWAQGRIEEAVRAERRAARLDQENRRYYQAQAEQFTSGPWH